MEDCGNSSMFASMYLSEYSSDRDAELHRADRADRADVEVPGLVGQPGARVDGQPALLELPLEAPGVPLLHLVDGDGVVHEEHGDDELPVRVLRSHELRHRFVAQNP